MTQRRRFYITTAIPYANGPPHIGHAYERIATDAIARFMRLDGRDVLFVTGMDEHGLKMQQTAAREGIAAQALADRTAAQFEAMGALLDARADDTVRTTQQRHRRASQAIWERMAANGDVYLSKYSGWYSVRDEAYFDEDELADGPDGTRLAPSGAPAEWVEEESYFFRLSAYAERLLAHYEAHPEFITPEKYRNEITAFVRRGLSDLSISRTTFDWGVPVPGDPRHVMYVWVDALTNYITATGFPDGGPRAHFWPADAHVIGKDITRFHAIYWPAFLMSARLATPRRIVVHGFLFNRGEKMSKSTGNIVDPAALAARYGVDQIRYFFLREVPFGQDGNYSHEAIVQRINADLANDLGNLAQRSLSMIARNCGGARAGLARRDGDRRNRPAAGGGRRADRRGARTYGELRDPSLSRRRVRRRRQSQSLFRQPRTLEARQDRRGADARRALCDDRDLAHRRHPAAAGDARGDVRIARSSRRSAGAPGFRRGRARSFRGARQARRLRTHRRGRSPAAGRGAAFALADLPAPRRARDRSRLRLIDSHCHLDFPDFAEEIETVVARARAAGVERLVAISTRVADGARLVALAERFRAGLFHHRRPSAPGRRGSADRRGRDARLRRASKMRRHRRGGPRLSLRLCATRRRKKCLSRANRPGARAPFAAGHPRAGCR